jgi:hypothetical protein
MTAAVPERLIEWMAVKFQPFGAAKRKNKQAKG